ncbi:MAG: histidine phosphatase family protein [Ilumatobacteraceae bacterium]
MSDPDAALPVMILLVRHGATEWSVTGRHTGRSDKPLTDVGIEQAERAGELIGRILGGRSALVFTSPLQRARHTAALAMPHNDATVVDALAEYDYGQYEGLTAAEIAERQPGWNLFVDGCPGGESLMQVSARCDSFIAKLERTAAQRAVVAFTHGHLSRVLTCRLLGLDPVNARLFENDTASVGTIAPKRGQLVLDGWNRR